MPLGETVGKLLNGVAAQAQGVKTDDLEATQNLTKRIGAFVENHPGLSESEFGDIVKDLVREVVAAEGTIKLVSEKEPEVAEYLVEPNNLDNEEEDKIDLAFV
jgi:hypothetical protein